MEKDDNNVRRFSEALKMAKASVMEACELFEDMKEQFSERGGRYSERYSMRDDMSPRDMRDMDDLRERRYRNSMGQYR